MVTAPMDDGGAKEKVRAIKERRKQKYDKEAAESTTVDRDERESKANKLPQFQQQPLKARLQTRGKRAAPNGMGNAYVSTNNAQMISSRERLGMVTRPTLAHPIHDDFPTTTNHHQSQSLGPQLSSTPSTTSNLNVHGAVMSKMSKKWAHGPFDDDVKPPTRSSVQGGVGSTAHQAGFFNTFNVTGSNFSSPMTASNNSYSISSTTTSTTQNTFTPHNTQPFYNNINGAIPTSSSNPPSTPTSRNSRHTPNPNMTNLLFSKKRNCFANGGAVGSINGMNDAFSKGSTGTSNQNVSQFNQSVSNFQAQSFPSPTNSVKRSPSISVALSVNATSYFPPAITPPATADHQNTAQMGNYVPEFSHNPFQASIIAQQGPLTSNLIPPIHQQPTGTTSSNLMYTQASLVPKQ